MISFFGQEQTIDDMLSSALIWKIIHRMVALYHENGNREGGMMLFESLNRIESAL